MKFSDIAQTLAQLDDLRDPRTYAKREQLQAMHLACEAVIHFAQRHAEQARAWAEIETNASRQRELRKIADVCQRRVAIYAERETVTRVLYALCQAHLASQSFEEALLQTFDEPDIIPERSHLGHTYAAGYQRYRAFAAFAWDQARSILKQPWTE